MNRKFPFFLVSLQLEKTFEQTTKKKEKQNAHTVTRSECTCETHIRMYQSNEIYCYSWKRKK